MKKFFLLILSGILCLCLVSCSREETIALTKDNIYDYIKISSQITDSTIERERESIFGITFYSYENSHAEARIMVNKTAENYSFENLTITLILSVSAGDKHPWEFKNQNYFENQNNLYYNCKKVTLEIPYTGEYVFDEKFVIGENELSTSVLDATDLSYIFIEIVAVSGNVIVKK